MSSRLMRAVLIVCGTLCVALGVLGIFLPLMPTTVFLLLAAACYARSSDRFYRRLVEHPVLGPYVSQRRGMTRRQKALALALLWASLGATMVWTTEAIGLRLLLAAVGAGVTLHLVRIPAASAVTPLPAAPAE